MEDPFWEVGKCGGTASRGNKMKLFPNPECRDLLLVNEEE